MHQEFVWMQCVTGYMRTDNTDDVKGKKVDKEVWKIEARYAFVLDDMAGKEAEIHLLRCAFVHYVDLNS